MKMLTYAFNDKRALTDFVNEKGITKDQIVSIYPEDGMIILHYFSKE